MLTMLTAESFGPRARGISSPVYGAWVHDDAERHYIRAYQESDRDPVAAIRDYTLYLKNVPGEPDALCNRGTLRFEAGDLEGGLADLDESLKSQPDNFVHVWHRARLKRIKPDLDGALGDFTKAIELHSLDNWLLLPRLRPLRSP
jgi:tetratricopeptide (TPR) repeat protein